MNQRGEIILSIIEKAKEFKQLLDVEKIADIPVANIKQWCDDVINIGSRVFALRKVTRRGVEYTEPNYEEYEEFENFKSTYENNKELINFKLGELIIIFDKLYPRIKKHFKL